MMELGYFNLRTSFTRKKGKNRVTNSMIFFFFGLNLEFKKSLCYSISYSMFRFYSYIFFLLVRQCRTSCWMLRPTRSFP